MTRDSKYAQFFGALKQAQNAGLQVADHHELVREYTNGRTDSLRDLDHIEYRELIQSLRNIVDGKAQSADRMRKKVIGLLCSAGFVNPRTHRADMPRIYAWVEKSGYLKKHFMKYAQEELPQLVYQAEQLQRSFVAQLKRQQHGQ